MGNGTLCSSCKSNNSSNEKEGELNASRILPFEEKDTLNLTTNISFVKGKGVEIDREASFIRSPSKDSYNGFFFKMKETRLTTNITQPVEEERIRISDYLPQFLSNQVEINALCCLHMLYSGISLLPDELFSRTFYLKRKILIALKDNCPDVNKYLKENTDSLNESAYNNVFDLLSDDNGRLINIAGFHHKRYYHCYDANSNYVFILNSDPNLLKEEHAKKEFQGIKILEKGKLLAGKFDEKGNLVGKGVLVNKKGNLFLGEFSKSDLEYAEIRYLNGTIYKGDVKAFKKHCNKGVEVKPDQYEFIGCFKENKRISGEFTFITPDPKNYIKKIHISDYMALMREETVKVLIHFEFHDRKLIYKGEMNSGKLTDPKGLLKEDNNVGYPCYEGNIFENSKEGMGTYTWRQGEYYYGNFSKNRLETGLNTADLNKIDKFLNSDNIPNFFLGRDRYKVVMSTGYLKGFRSLPAPGEMMD